MEHQEAEQLTQTRANALADKTYPCMRMPAKTMMIKAKKSVKPRTTVHQTGVVTMYGPLFIEVNAACVGTCDMVLAVEILLHTESFGCLRYGRGRKGRVEVERGRSGEVGLMMEESRARVKESIGRGSNI